MGGVFTVACCDGALMCSTLVEQVESKNAPGSSRGVLLFRYP